MLAQLLVQHRLPWPLAMSEGAGVWCHAAGLLSVWKAWLQADQGVFHFDPGWSMPLFGVSGLNLGFGGWQSITLDLVMESSSTMAAGSEGTASGEARQALP